jgi:hypothetical protein
MNKNQPIKYYNMALTKDPSDPTNLYKIFLLFLVSAKQK